MQDGNGFSHLHFFVFLSDRGPNEVLARKIWQVVARNAPGVIVFALDCLEHASHLITLGSLKLVDKLLKPFRSWKYFSSIASTSITLRDLSKDVFSAWCEAHGPESGVKLAKTLWPKCVAGRWNSCNDMETRMRACGGQRMLLPVLKQILASKPAEKEAKGNLAAGSVDEIQVEESAHYSAQMGRWRARTLACVADALWWVVAEVMRVARGPALALSDPSAALSVILK